MANSSKFVSVNLNKSYGQPPTGAFGHGRTRAGAGASGGTGGGGGMVVLSRPRSSGSAGQKGPPKLSVPPPLNLPSRRKEHEGLDPSSATGSSVRPGSSGVGSGAGSSTMGWTKPAVLLERDGPLPLRSPDPRGGRAYMPPSARSSGQPPTVEKAVLLRGEDFPSLGAATVTPMLKQKDLKQKPRGEDAVHGRLERPDLSTPLDMRPMRSARSNVNEKIATPSTPEKPQKQDGYFPGPLPLVRLSHKSDWADDERDTGLSIPERDRGFSDGSGGASTEFFRGDSFRRENAIPSRDARDAGSWRAQQATAGASRDIGKEGNYSHLPRSENGYGYGYGAGRDMGSRTSTQNGRNVAEAAYNGRTDDQRGRYGDFSNNWSRGDAFQNSKIAKNTFSSGSKGFSLNDPILNFGKEKRPNSNNGKPYLDDGGMDSSDAFSGGLFGEVNAKVFKKKKDALKEADFHDPVRESFEAELERVQRMQEMERQRAMEEQNRALEFARREQEQRERLVREEEERRRRVEEEAREAAWRAEQEKMEIARRAEAQRVAREEEKRRIFMEEERRKEAARKKLLELEARMAKRHGEGNSKDDRPPSSATDERLPMLAKEGDTQRATDIGEWEDGERMVERITSTASSDSSSTRPHSSRDGNSSFIERGKHASNWRRDTFDNGNNTMFFSQDQDTDYHSPRRDTLATTRSYPRKETHGNLGAPARPMSKGVTSEALQVPDDLRYPKHRWNIADGDYFNRNSDIDANFLDSDKFGDAVWGPGHSRGSPHASYTERPYQNSEMDEFSTFGRSRHSLRQPRVLPPPSVSMRRSPFRAASEFPSSSSFIDSEMSYQHSGKAEEASYDPAETLQPPAKEASLTQSTVPSEQKVDKNSMRCDSQSSLSVSSPPASPTHEDLDESEDFQTQPTSAVGESTAQSEDEHIPAPQEAGDSNILPPSSPLSHGEDDEWATENHEIPQEQEEYDEDDDGYQEEEDGNAENLDPRQELEIIQSEVVDTSVEADQIVLGFDDGVQVNIPINDELEKDTGIDVAVQLASVGVAQEQIHSDAVAEAENDSSTIITDADKLHQDLGLHPDASTSTVEEGSSEMLSPAISSSALVQPILSSVSTSPVQPVLSSVPTMAPQSEVPFQLQFGLFSGPSLFPSPVPAIQIGSIQMPLHLHPQVGPSVSHMHAPPPPLLQFGQLRYAPLTPQTVSFAQPSSAHHSLNKNVACSVSLNDSAQSLVDKQHVITKPSNVSRNSIDRGPIHALPVLPRNDVACHNQTGGSSFVEVRSRYGPASHTDRRGIRDFTVKKNYRPLVNNMESQFHVEHNPSRSFLGEKPGSRGRRFAYAVRNVGSRTPFSGPDVSQHTDSAGFQRRPRRNVRRTEFRVRENADKRHTEVVSQFNSAGQDGRLDFNANMHMNTSRYGGKKDAGPSKSTKTVESENINSGASSSRVVITDGKMDKVSRKDISSKKRLPAVHNLYSGEGNMKRNGISEDVDAPLQSNIVRVFNQPGIEVPSDEDDFIQVRSKRQMLNDRRERREKELKAMSRAVKTPRKTRAAPQSNTVQSKSNRAVSSTSGDRTENNRAGFGITDGRGFATVESSPMFTANIASQSLPPIGTPSSSVDSSSKSKNLKSGQTGAVPTVSSGGTKFVPDLSFEKNSKAFDIASVPLVSWGNVDINQQVMALTQSQLDEAMQPARSQASSSIAHEPIKPPTSITTLETTFSSSPSSLNSLLVGQTIQFGAVTSPAILPPVIRAMPNGIGLPASTRPDVGTAPKLPNDCTLLFDKEKRPSKSCTNIKDPEAEAAASAVAVAAISNTDEVAGNRLSVCSVSVSDTRNFNTSDAITLTSKGLTGSEEVTGQSVVEDSLAVSLPADLSVDTPSLPLWPPLPSPQSSSGPMISHFPPPSHFPCFEMNPMLGAPIFAFGPQDESAGTQAHPQSTTMGSGGWPQCHSTIDSFYGPPTGYSGPFIAPPGGIPGVQGPPHMVVYNHFAPVGQFGQVGLSFMGTTYIPTGKQPDWKHNPVSSAAGVSESGVSGPRNPSGMPTIQHLAPGSPLMQMGSPLTMFDMPPFQSSADVPMQARWSHISVPPMHSLPLPVSLQQHQVEGMPSQFGRNPPGDNRFHDARVATTPNVNRSTSTPQNSSPQFPNEMGLVDPPSNDNKTSRPSGTPDNKGANSSKSSARTMTNTGESGGNGNSRGQVVGSTLKFTDQRGSGASQKVASGGEWHRRTGYQGRNQPSGSDKSSNSSKVKQIYVPKSQTGNSVTG